MTKPTVPLACLLMLAAAPSERVCAGPMLSADTGWQQIDQKSGVTLYSRTRVGTSLKEFKGTGQIDAAPDAVEKVLEDVESYTSFMPYVAEARVISRTGTECVTYQKLTLPMVENRDYTVKVEHDTSKTASGALTYRDTWTTANEQGPPEKHGLVRVKVNEGTWLLEPSGAGTQATYQIYTDSGGAIPAFMANHASQTIIPRLFDAIRKQVKDPKYGK